MTPLIVDAFTKVPYGGNAAGIVLLEREYPPDGEMLALAAKLGLSETAFILARADGVFSLRYFTPAAEVELCGHATVASFYALLQWGYVQTGHAYTARTLAGEVSVNIDTDGCVWMDMAPPQELGGLNGSDAEALYAMFGLKPDDAGCLEPAIVNTGLPDIMMPVKNREILASLRPDFAAISDLSKRLNVTGVHVFALGADAVTAYVRNFAPLYDIDEEAATGTSNGALTHYLYRRGLVKPEAVNVFVQGEAMGRPSEIRSRLTLDGTDIRIRIGGYAAMRAQAE